MTRFVVPVLLAALAPLAATAAPTTGATAAPTAAPSRSLVVMCQTVRLYAWTPGSGVPQRTDQIARLGETFGYVSGPRYTLDGHGYDETSIPVLPSTGGGTHYWIPESCANASVRR